MNQEIEIRESEQDDATVIEELYPAVFPDEDLVPLVHNLLAEKDGVTSLVAAQNGVVVGHAVFTACSIAGHTEKIALLGPIAVSPDVQKQGIGSSIIRAGFEQLKAQGFAEVYVLGDPAYYERFGFTPSTSVMTPYPLPAEWATAWQSVSLSDETQNLEGTLIVPGVWQEPKLWTE